MPPNEPVSLKGHTTGLLERLEKGIVLSAEGYLFELERRGYIKAGAYVPEAVLDYPDALRELHREFLRCGSEVLVAFTYYAHRDKLRVIGREGDLERLNVNALRIAKEIAKEGDNILVAGNICNTWIYDPKNPVQSGKVVRAMYEEQVQWAVDAGVDFIIAETLEYVGEALIALDVIKSHGLPAVVTFTAVWKQSKDGYDWIEGCKLLEAKGCDVVGFNCGRGPNTLLPLLRELRASVDCFIAAQPVPYYTTEEEPSFQLLKDRKGRNGFSLGLERHLCTREEMGNFAREAKKIGINYVGICCGGAPYHVREMAEALGRVVPASKYSADFRQHAMLGDDAIVKKHEKPFRKTWDTKNVKLEELREADQQVL